MWTIIAEKELRDHLQSTRFLVAASVTALLIVTSIWLGIAHYKARVAQYEQGVQMMLDLATQQTNWMMVSASAWRKPDAMEIFTNGVNSDIGRYSDIGSWRDVRLVRSEYSDDPMLAAFQFLDPAFVVLIVLSLVAILFTYNAVNGEKEGGTLKLVFANKLSKADYILGKLTGSWLAILAPVLISFLIGALLLIASGIDFDASHWGRYAFFVLISVLYTTCFMLIGVFVSALTHRSSVSFLILLVVWICAVLIVPKAATMLAGQAMPVPTVDEVESRLASYSTQARNEYFNDMMKRSRERFQSAQNLKEEERQQMMTQWNKENEDKRKVMDQSIADYTARLYEDYYNQKSQQELLAFSLAKFSPASQFQLATMKLSGTDTGLKKRYEDAMKEYKKQYGDFTTQKGGGGFSVRVQSSGRGSSSGSMSGPPQTKIDVTEMPKFKDPQYSFGAAVVASLFDIGLLAVFNVLAFVGAFVAFLRFDMR
jgi:ABC-type transport system involved in multi-copper enzyme maturation permease subunit